MKTKFLGGLANIILNVLKSIVRVPVPFEMNGLVPKECVQS